MSYSVQLSDIALSWLLTVTLIVSNESGIQHISCPKLLFCWPPEHVSGAENGAERAKNWVEWSEAVSGVAESDGAGMERGVREVVERRAGLTEMGLRAE